MSWKAAVQPLVYVQAQKHKIGNQTIYLLIFKSRRKREVNGILLLRVGDVMEKAQRPEELIKRYLLGDLSTAEQTAIEDEYFLDGSKYDQLRKAEDDLIDRYARGALSQADRERFEIAYLANPQRRRHVKFSQAFAQVLDEELSARNSVERSADVRTDRGQKVVSQWSQLIDRIDGRRLALRLASTIAALFIASIGMWSVNRNSRLRAQLAETQREVEAQRQSAHALVQKIADLETRAQELTEERTRLQDQLQAQAVVEAGSTRSEPASIIFPLTISVFRDPGQETPVLIIPRGVEEVRLLLNPSEQRFPDYQVMLLRVDGKELFSRKGIRPRSSESPDIMVRIPSRKFANGDNMLSVSGISSTGELETLSRSIIKVRRRRGE